MSKTVACVVVTTPKVFSWLGHMPIMNWSLNQLTEVRGIDRIVCVADPSVAARAKALLAREDIEVVVMPRGLVDAKADAVEKWLSSAAGPAAEADVVVVSKCTTPFLPAAKIEACLTHVARGKCSNCVPARDASIVAPTSPRRVSAKEPIDTVKVFRVNVPTEQVVNHTVRVNLMESLDVTNQDEFVLAAALADSDKV